MTDMTPDYLGQAVLTGKIVIRTGLHIGAGKDTVEIGGIDSPVVKTPEGDPYIPGSSLKGKLRSLLEWAFGKVNPQGGPWADTSDATDPILRIFGTSADKNNWTAGPTRMMMRDASVEKDWRDKALHSGMELTEDKTEVVIDRISGAAASAGARHVERVPPGAVFDFEAAFKIFSVEGDNGERDCQCIAWLIQGLDLLEQDALGGSGSRGYGRVSFRDLKLKGPHDATAAFDNNFRGHVFSREHPPETIAQLVKQALGAR